MCDDRDEENSKEDDEMSAPSMKPMEVRFNSEEERQRFLKWAESKVKTNNAKMNKVRKNVKEAREMRNRGVFKF